MKHVGEFWLPDVDLRRWSNWGKTRRKTLERYGTGSGPKAADMEAALANIPKGGLALDGGANVGAYTRIMAQHFDRVIAFEPAPDTFACLERNVRDWGLGERVEVRPVALSDRREQVGLKGRFGHRSLSRRVSGPGAIQSLPIDDLELPALAFLKLDLEGYEVRALRGALATLQRCRPYVLFEDKPHKSELYGEAREAHDILLSLGARLIARIGKNGNDWLYGFTAD